MSIALNTEVSFRHGASLQTDPALADLDGQLGFDGCAALILYVSSNYDLERLGEEIARRVRVPLLCCATAGEINSQHGYTNGGMTAAAVTHSSMG